MKRSRREQRTNTYEVEICPNCNDEIGEKGSYVDNFGKSDEFWTHRACGGQFVAYYAADGHPFAESKDCGCGQYDIYGKCACNKTTVFAPYFGDGNGHSMATMPHDNVSQDGKESESPASGAKPGAGGINSPDVPAGTNMGTGPVVSSLSEALSFAIRAVSSPMGLDQDVVGLNGKDGPSIGIDMDESTTGDERQILPTEKLGPFEQRGQVIVDTGDRRHWIVGLKTDSVKSLRAQYHGKTVWIWDNYPTPEGVIWSWKIAP